VTVLVVLFTTPAAVPVTDTVMVHVPPGALSGTPVAVMVLDPSGAVTVPPQSVVRPPGVEIRTPAGSVSVKATLVKSTTWFGFVSVNIRLAVAPTGRPTAANAFVSAGGYAAITPAVAKVVDEPPSLELTTLLTLL